MAGLFVAIEGIDAAGKGTQSRLLAERLRATLLSFPVYETPVGKLIGAHLRREWSATSLNGSATVVQDYPGDPLIFQSLMTLNRYEMAPSIEAERARGKNIVCDRYYMSGVVYAEVDGVDSTYVKDNISAFLPEPDIHILLDITVEEMVKRRPTARDRYEKDTESMLKRATTYKAWWERMRAKQGSDRWAVIDGVGTIEEVHKRICETVARVRGV